MMRKYKVSVVIPIYGVEKYISRCAHALFSQTLDDIQYVFVNDCTKDKSMEVLQSVIIEYPSRKNDITIVTHEHNQGLPQARKSGITYCTGEYIAHCDSDDWPESNMYEIMYNEAKEMECDIVSCDYYKSDGTTKKHVRIGKSRSLMQGPVWNKIVKRNIYFENDILYPTANKAEDGALMTQLSYFGQKRSHVCDALYYYYNNPDSMCRIISKQDCIKRLNEECENVEFRVNFLKKIGCEKKFQSDVYMWKYVARRNLLPYIRDYDIYKIWANTYPELNKDFLLNRNVNYKPKIEYLIIRLHLYNLLKLKDIIKKYIPNY